MVHEGSLESIDDTGWDISDKAGLSHVKSKGILSRQIEIDAKVLSWQMSLTTLTYKTRCGWSEDDKVEWCLGWG